MSTSTFQGKQHIAQHYTKDCCQQRRNSTANSEQSQQWGNVRAGRQEEKQTAFYSRWNEKKSEQSRRGEKRAHVRGPRRSADRSTSSSSSSSGGGRLLRSPPPPPPPPRLHSCGRSLLTSTSTPSQTAELFGRNLNNTWKRRGKTRPERIGEAGTTSGYPFTTMAIFTKKKKRKKKKWSSAVKTWIKSTQCLSFR